MNELLGMADNSCSTINLLILLVVILQLPVYGLPNLSLQIEKTKITCKVDEANTRKQNKACLYSSHCWPAITSPITNHQYWQGNECNYYQVWKQEQRRIAGWKSKRENINVLGCNVRHHDRKANDESCARKGNKRKQVNNPSIQKWCSLFSNCTTDQETDWPDYQKLNKP